MKQSRRSFLGRVGAFTAISMLGSSAVAQTWRKRVFTPEMFGAKGDSITDDSAAMAALAAAVNANRGGTVRFRRTTYRVGAQRASGVPGAPYSFEPAKLLEFRGCTRSLMLQGNGARLRCGDGLRYGIFSSDGAALRHPMPYIGPGAATPYFSMIRIEACSGPIEISDIELDGNLASLQIGGGYGDTGWQLAAVGLALVDNQGSEIVRNVFAHHHAQDGLYIDGLDQETAVRRQISGVRSEHNGRQGCSIVGGQGYAFDNCSFSHTGRAGLASAPGAGVDIEAEAGKKVRGISFVGCRFIDNYGCGLVADNGDTDGVTFERSTFVGTTSWSAWPCKPNFTFEDCVFAGAITQAFGEASPERAAKFFGCTFTDDPTLSPTLELFGGENPSRPLADLSDVGNILFERCNFLAHHKAALPWSLGAIYVDCRMEQSTPQTGYPRGTFRGRTTINGNVDLYGSRITGEIMLNGVRVGPNLG